MIKKLILYHALLVLGLSLPIYSQADVVSAYAQNNQVCSKDLIDLIGQHQKIDYFTYPLGDTRGVIVADACKVWPKDEAITLAAIAYKGEFADVLNLAVVMIDNGSNKVVASYKGVIEQNATMRIEKNSLKIDTARFDVQRGLRAFGVDVTSGIIFKCSKHGLGTFRSLYLQDGDKIRPILEGFYLSYWRIVRGGEMRCMGDAYVANKPKPLIETISMKIAMSKVKSNGYFDMSVFSINTYDDGTANKRDPFLHELKYDGKKYPIEKMNAAFWQWREKK